MKGFTSVTTTDLLDWLRLLVAYRSEQSEAMEFDPAVQALGRQCVEPIVRNAGLLARYDEFGNLFVPVGPANSEITLAFFCYAMTHPGSRMENAFECTELHANGEPYLRGRGISEQKGAMAASLAAFLDFARHTAPTRQLVWVLLTAGETGRHDAMESALRALGQTPRHSILAVGSSMRIDAGHRGRLDIEVDITGRACHSSTPWLGADVTEGVRIVLERIDNLRALLPRHDELGAAQLTCTSIHTGPQATHTVQSDAHLTFDRRLLPGENVDRILAELTSTWELPPPLSSTVRKGPFMHGHLLPRDSNLLANVSRALAEAELPLPQVGLASGALDCGLLQERGGEACMWGPGDPTQFHTADEQVAIADVIGMAERYRAVLQSTSMEARWT